MKVVRIAEIDPIPVVGGELQWRPVRRTLGIDNENALEHLREAVTNPRMRQHAETDSDFDSLREDPRFSEALESPPA